MFISTITVLMFCTKTTVTAPLQTLQNRPALVTDFKLAQEPVFLIWIKTETSTSTLPTISNFLMRHTLRKQQEVFPCMPIPGTTRRYPIIYIEITETALLPT